MKQYKLFISQPMRGKTDEEILSTRAWAIDGAKKALKDTEDPEDSEVHIIVIDSFFKGADVEGANALSCLGDSLKLMSMADIVYFAKDWEKYRGCRIEHACAEEYDMTFIEDYRPEVER